MSFFETITEITAFHHTLSAKVPCPVDIFMSSELLAKSEELLWQEVVTIANFPGVRRVCVTPDAHASGNGIPVGVAVETEGIIIPCAAGYDISCGMAAVRSSLTLDDVADNAKVRAWIDAVELRVATGAGRQRAPLQRVVKPSLFREVLLSGALAVERDRKILHNLERTHLPVDTSYLLEIEKAKRGEGQLGSEGGGNHFISMEIDQDGQVWFLIHTGSRGFGHGTAEYFFLRGASELGLAPRDKEKVWFDSDSQIGRQYENCMNAAANFAIVNRLMIYRAVEEAVGEVFNGTCSLFYEISHNLVQREGGYYVHRKGATRAFPAGHEALQGTPWAETGHPILIPGSMGTASAILYANQAAEKSIYSINHGCGRVMGRGQAKRELGALQDEIDAEMDQMGILINTRNTPLDECLHVYKGIDDVLASVEGAGLARVAYKVRPRAVIKGAD